MARILLVEDENIINMATQDRVEAMGHTVCGTAATGEEGIEQAGAKQPDVVIMDINLRGKMDGIEAAKRIRESFGIPVIYLTAYDDEETRQRAGATDPVAYLVKILGDVDLQSAIDKALEKGKDRPPGQPERCGLGRGSSEPCSMRPFGEDTVRAEAIPEIPQ